MRTFQLISRIVNARLSISRMLHIKDLIGSTFWMKIKIEFLYFDRTRIYIKVRSLFHRCRLQCFNMKQYIICSSVSIYTLYCHTVTILFDNVSVKCVYLSNQKVYKFILSKIESRLHSIFGLVWLQRIIRFIYFVYYNSDNLSRNSFIAVITHVVDNIGRLTTFLLSIESTVGMKTAAKIKESIKPIIFDKWKIDVKMIFCYISDATSGQHMRI